jgi:hypothetical protein
MALCRIHQIYYSEATKARLDPGFVPFWKPEHERMDWREYTTFEKLYRRAPLDERVLHGAWSVKFRDKTGLTSNQVNAFVASLPETVDVVLFCPYVHELCMFQSVVHQGEARAPGLMEATVSLLAEAGRPFDPKRFASSAIDGVYCNFFVAKPAFWRAWFELADFALDPGKASPALRRQLDQRVPHRDGTVPMGVFVLERIASILICQDRRWRVAAFSPFAIARGLGNTALESSIMLDALKGSFVRTGHADYLDTFHAYRRMLASARQVA